MLPNRLEFGALVFAISRLGGVYSGIPTAAGLREAGHMLRTTAASVLVLTPGFRGSDHLALARRLLDEAPALRHVVVLGDDPPADGPFVAFERLAAAEALPDDHPVDAGALAHLGFTSGTTGEPKGVINTHETLEAVWRNWVEHVGGPAALGEPAVNLIASPVGHHTGFLWGTLLSAHLAATAVYLDRWVPAVAARVLSEQRVTTMHGAPTFLQDLVRVPGFDASAVPALKAITLAGAPIPRALVPAAAEQLDVTVNPAWGMTEYGIGISARPGLPPERRAATDGCPVPGCEVRVTVDGRPAPPGAEGALEIRGAGLFLGYYRRPDATAEAIVDGWFRTGDVARRDEDGLVSLQGRTKDIVIRGGENIPVAAVETLLFEHPRIVEAAVVGVPDERLGERACAVVVCDGEPVGLEEIVEFLLARGLSKHYLPERAELVDALPKTMSGKVRKTQLRDRYGSG
jgi:cyclohexanecarboxylate-CoA ligase